MAYTESNINNAVHFVASLTTDSSSTAPSLVEAIKGTQPKKNHRLSLVFIVTAAIIDDVNIHLLKAFSLKFAEMTKIQAVGVGFNESTEEIVKTVAHATGGKWISCPTEKRIAESVIKLLKQALKPVAENVRTEWHSGKSTTTMVPAKLPSWYLGGSTLYQYAMMEPQQVHIDGSVTLNADLSSKSQSFQSKFNIEPHKPTDPSGTKRVDDSLPVHRLAAKYCLRDIVNDALMTGMDIESIRKEAVGISIMTGISCDFTGFIAINDKDGSLVKNGPIFVVPDCRVNYYVDDDGVAYNLGNETSKITVKSRNAAKAKALLAVAKINCTESGTESQMVI